MAEEEPLMNLRPKTTYEKLLWEREITKQLKEELKQSEYEKGELQSELDELKHRMKKDQKGALILKNRKLEEAAKTKNQTIKKLKEDKEELILSVVRLQTTGSISNKVDEKASETHASGSPA